MSCPLGQECVCAAMVEGPVEQDGYDGESYEEMVLGWMAKDLLQELRQQPDVLRFTLHIRVPLGEHSGWPTTPDGDIYTGERSHFATWPVRPDDVAAHGPDPFFSDVSDDVGLGPDAMPAALLASVGVSVSPGTVAAH